MGKTTAISWAKSTLGLWIGCTQVDVDTKDMPGQCARCYAERTDKRGLLDGGRSHWGVGTPRYRTAATTWNQARTWNKQAPTSEFAGRKGFWPVFLNSQADFFDNEVPNQWRADAWELIRACPNLLFIITTKRIGLAAKMLPEDWGDGYPNVLVQISVGNQKVYDRDVPKLQALPVRRRGLSMEPLFDSIDMHGERFDIVITGGESGPGARDSKTEWYFRIMEQCAAVGSPFHMKQITESGRLIPKEHWPHRLRVQEFPS